MNAGIAVLVVCLAVVPIPLAGKPLESKLDRLIRLLTELKEKNVEARDKEEISTWDSHVIKSTHSAGETKATEFLREYAGILDSKGKPVWTANVLMTRKGGRAGVFVHSKFMDREAFKKTLDDLKKKDVIGKDQREAAATYMASNKATKFSAVVRISYKPAGTLLAIGSQ